MMDNGQHTEELAERLRRERPVPSAGFRGRLRRSLMDDAGRVAGRPDRLGLFVTAYGSSGIALLLFAILGLTGVGPLGAG